MFSDSALLVIYTHTKSNVICMGDKTVRKFIGGVACLTGGLVACVSPAWASNDDGCSAYTSGGSAHYYNCGASPGASSTDKTGETVNRASTAAIGTAIGNRIAGALKGGTTRTAAAEAVETGVATGEAGPRYALWAAVGATSVEGSVPGAAFDGTLSNQTGGFDMLLNDRTVVGVSVFHEGNSIKTGFNSGHLDADAWWAVPYVGHDFGQGSSIDALMGLAYVSGDATRANHGAKGAFDGYRSMAAVNGHHSLDLGGSWLLRGDVGALWAYSRTNGYEEKGAVAQRQAAATSHLVQGKVGGRLSTLWGQVEPFAAAYYAYDFVADRVGDDGVRPGGSSDADEFQFYVGFDWMATDTESVGIEAHKVVGRDRSDAMGLLLNARLRF